MKSLTEMKKESLELIMEYLVMDIGLLQEQPNQEIVYDIDQYGNEGSFPRSRTHVMQCIEGTLNMLEEFKTRIGYDNPENKLKMLTEDKKNYDILQETFEEIELIKQEAKTHSFI